MFSFSEGFKIVLNWRRQSIKKKKTMHKQENHFRKETLLKLIPQYYRDHKFFKSLVKKEERKAFFFLINLSLNREQCK